MWPGNFVWVEAGMWFGDVVEDVLHLSLHLPEGLAEIQWWL